MATAEMPRLDGEISPVCIFRPKPDRSQPLLVSSPHSGRYYPRDWLRRVQLSELQLRRSEDAYVDRLIDGVEDDGAYRLQALFPRVCVDANRGPWELDPGMFADHLPSFVDTLSQRAASGLGVVPRLGAEGRPLYRRRFRFAEARELISRFYMPYHRAFTDMVEEIRRVHGFAVIVDMHSMPHNSAKGVDFVLGDRFGASCSIEITDRLERLLKASGFVTHRNTPYAGGYTTEHYGKPENGNHVIQIEINRSLYLDESRVRLKRDWLSFHSKIRKLIKDFVSEGWSGINTP